MAAVRSSIFLGIALHPCAIWAVLTGIRVINNGNNKRICEGRKEMGYWGELEGRRQRGQHQNTLHKHMKVSRIDTNIFNREKSNFPKLLQVKL